MSVSDDLHKMILDDLTKTAERDLEALFPRPEPSRPILAEMPRMSREELEREERAYTARLQQRVQELEAKLENCIEISPVNAKLIIQFLPKPADGADWEVDATIDLLWKELERQAAKA